MDKHTAPNPLQQLAAWAGQGRRALEGMGHALQQAVEGPMQHFQPLQLPSFSFPTPAQTRSQTQNSPWPCARNTQQAPFEPATFHTALASISASHMQAAAGGAHADSSATAAQRKAELGRATWTLLHMLAAQFPEKPTKQQQRDVKELINCLTRVYPCADCASHFQEVVK